MIINIFLLLIAIARATINPFGPTIVHDYANCIIQLIEKEFRKPGLLIFAINKNASTSVLRVKSEVLKNINKYEKYSVQVASPDKERAICGTDHESNNILHHLDDFEAVPTADYFIIVIDKHEELYYLASKLIRSRSWNPKAKFIILLFHITSNDIHVKQVVENILTCLFYYYVINIVIVVPQENKIRNASIYGWRPYDPPYYCGYENETAKNRLKEENLCEKGIVKYKRSVFESRIPSDMKGCALFILALEREPFISSNEDAPNIERWLMRALVKHSNFTPRYEILSTFRGEKDSGEWDGALRELLNKRGNVLVGGIFPDNDVHEDFETSSAYLADSYTWVVPRAFPSPRWLSLLIIFDKVVWSSVIATFIICAISWKVLGWLSQDSYNNKTVSHCFLNTWICTLGFCTYTRPKKGSLRTFFVFLNLYCVMCITAYQTKLIDVLRNPSFDYQIQTVEELVDSGLKFGGFEELQDLFQNSSDPLDNYIGEQWTNVNDISEAMINVAVHRNFSLLSSRLELAHISAIVPELSDNFGNFKFYSFPMNVFSVPMEMVTMKGFPFLNEFDDTLGLLKQAGINAALRRVYASLNKRKRAKLLRSIESHNPVIDALSLQHLQGGFLILVFGYVLGSISLLFEIGINHFVKRKHILQQKH